MSINGRRLYEANFRCYLPADRGATILDIGCGSGEFLQYLEQNGYCNLTGIEIDPARAEASREATSARIVLTNALDDTLRALPHRYDLITLKSVIAHFPRARLLDYLGAIRDCLSEDGQLVVETYNASRWTGTYLLFNDVTHEWAYTEYSLPQALEAAGFRVLQLTGDRVPIRRARTLAWYALQQLWVACLRTIYFAERGIGRNPRILSKYLIALCDRAPSASR
jgi:cyclopropane fatty-acyl-phospholipid synthase-like methyltransferase